MLSSGTMKGIMSDHDRLYESDEPQHWPSHAMPSEPRPFEPLRRGGLAPGLLNTPIETDAAAGMQLTKVFGQGETRVTALNSICLLYTSDAADE